MLPPISRNQSPDFELGNHSTAGIESAPQLGHAFSGKNRKRLEDKSRNDSPPKSPMGKQFASL
jgi:hypothetical protein